MSHVGLGLISITSGKETMKLHEKQGRRANGRQSRRNASILVELLEGRALLSVGGASPFMNPAQVVTPFSTTSTNTPAVVRTTIVSTRTVNASQVAPGSF